MTLNKRQLDVIERLRAGRIAAVRAGHARGETSDGLLEEFLRDLSVPADLAASLRGVRRELARAGVPYVEEAD